MTTNQLDQKLDQWLETNKTWMVEELKQWVSHPSVSRADLAEEGAPYGPDCRKMLDFALLRAEELGFRVRDNSGYCGDIFLDGQLAGEEGANPEPNEIGFVCHLDVVPEGDHWIYEPYKPVEKDGFLIGRGVGDNKGSAVLVLSAMKFLKETQISLKKTIRLMLGCAEETGMADYRHYLNELNGTVPAVSIVADAGFPVCYGQKGGYNAALLIPAGSDIVDFSAGSVRNIIPDTAVLTIKGVTVKEAEEALAGQIGIEVEAAGSCVAITARGKSGHAAFPEGGDNAIRRLAEAVRSSELIQKLDLAGISFLADAFISPYGSGLGIDFEDQESGKLTLNAGVIKKEDGHLKVDIDIRYPVTVKAEQITAILDQVLAENQVQITEKDISNPYYINPSDPKVTALMQIYKEITGDDAKPYTMGGGTYSRVVPNAISYGPGLRYRNVRPDFLPEGHGNAHGPDETLNIESWLIGFRIYIHSILKLDQLEL